MPRLAQYVHASWARKNRPRLSEIEKTSLCKGMLSRLLDALPPTTKVAVHKLDEHTKNVKGLISATLDADGLALGHGINRVWNTFVMLHGLELLCGLSTKEQVCMWKEHCRVHGVHAWGCLQGACVFENEHSEVPKLLCI
jgi:hypothetical protein